MQKAEDSIKAFSAGSLFTVTVSIFAVLICVSCQFHMSQISHLEEEHAILFLSSFSVITLNI